MREVGTLVGIEIEKENIDLQISIRLRQDLGIVRQLLQGLLIEGPGLLWPAHGGTNSFTWRTSSHPRPGIAPPRSMCGLDMSRQT